MNILHFVISGKTHLKTNYCDLPTVLYTNRLSNKKKRCLESKLNFVSYSVVKNLQHRDDGPATFKMCKVFQSSVIMSLSIHCMRSVATQERGIKLGKRASVVFQRQNNYPARLLRYLQFEYFSFLRIIYKLYLARLIKISAYYIIVNKCEMCFLAVKLSSVLIFFGSKMSRFNTQV